MEKKMQEEIDLSQYGPIEEIKKTYSIGARKKKERSRKIISLRFRQGFRKRM